MLPRADLCDWDATVCSKKKDGRRILMPKSGRVTRTRRKVICDFRPTSDGSNRFDEKRLAGTV